MARLALRLHWVLLDTLVVIASFFVAVIVRFLDSPERDLQAGLVAMATSIGPLVVLFVGVNALSGLDRRVWRYASAAEVIPVFAIVMMSSAIALVADFGLERGGQRPVPLSVMVLGSFFSFCGMVVMRYRSRLVSRVGSARMRRDPIGVRTLVYGAGEAGQLLAWRFLNQSEGRRYQLIGFVDDDPSKRGLRIHGLRVLGSRSDLKDIVERERIELIVLAVTRPSGGNVLDVVSAAQETAAQIKVLPSVFESMARKHGAPLLREMQVQDFLGRRPAEIDIEACSAVLRDKTVLITGGCGSVGSELCRQAATFDPRHLVVLDNNESGLFDFEVEIRAKYPQLSATFVVGDVTDHPKMDRLFGEARPNVIFHAAAYKHVPLMEVYPEEAARVNIRGTQLILTMSQRYGAKHFVLVSTDKAVNPGSVMGATKRICELMLTNAEPSASLHTGEDYRTHTLCTAVRFGNVLGSRGSVVPTFAKQIEMGGPVTVTHPEMTRYFMDVSEAACLIIHAASMTNGKDIFMLEMGERIRVDDLARKMIRMRGLRPEIDVQIVYTGVRPGEKLHEELVRPEDEVTRTSHPLIYRVLARGANGLDNVESAVDRLLKLAEGCEREELVRELMRMSAPLASLPSNGELHVPPAWNSLVSENPDRQ